MAASPINPSDLAFAAGAYVSGPKAPLIPGFEGSGTVVEAGPGLLPRLLLRRRVAFATGNGGAWADYVTLPAVRAIPVGNLPLEQSAMLVVNPMTALTFFEIARQEGHEALVSDAAASALGRMILRLGQSHRVPVVHIVRRREQADQLRGLGGEHVLIDSEPGFRERLSEVAHRLSATLLLDAVAGPRTGLLVDAAPPRSTILAYASLSGEESAYHPRSLIGGDKKISSFYLGHWLARRGLLRTLLDVRKVRALAGTLLRTEVQARLPLTAAAEAVALYRRGMTLGKVLLLPNPSTGS